MDPHVDQKEENFNIDEAFEELFKIHQFDIDIKETDLYLNLLKRQKNFKNEKFVQKRKSKKGKKIEDEKMEVENAIDQINNDDKNLKVPFDMIFMKYIFMNSTN